jgi:hypothetical protein
MIGGIYILGMDLEHIAAAQCCLTSEKIKKTPEILLQE